MKLSDYVASYIASLGVKHIFLITGGAAVHLVDSIAKNPNLKYICTNHEQAAAMAAEAYSRITESIGVALATSGPGATNLATGICCAYFDSIPTIFITGQVPRSQLKTNYGVRQLGFQETDVVSMFKTVTKYAILVEDPQSIKYHLEKGTYLARSGRPGPVLLDIPDDVQRTNVNPITLKSFLPPKDIKCANLDKQVDEVLELVRESRRPVVILGGGVRLAKAQDKAKEFIRKLGFPVALTWAAMDILPYDYPSIINGFGVSSLRWGNFAVQNSDFILAIGTRLDTHETGDNVSSFAREAKKVVVDIDSEELDKYKNRGMRVDISINYNATVFFDSINPKLDSIKIQDITPWVKKIEEWKSKYPICPPIDFKSRGWVSPYSFVDCLSDETKEGDIIITDAGATLIWTMQAFKVKKGQRLFSAFNHSPMGYALPASIGASLAGEKSSIICITGDGGLQMNIQELATIVKHKLPIKIFVLDNFGYGIIRQTQDTWLESRHVASSIKTGVPIPNIMKVARGYDLLVSAIYNHAELKDKIKVVLETKTPILCNVHISPNEKIVPKLSFGKPIEDSEPLLDRKEFLDNMIVKPLEEL